MNTTIVSKKSEKNGLFSFTMKCATRLLNLTLTTILQSTYISDASRIWNKCPNHIKECDTLWKAKNSIKSFVATLPI